MWGVQGIKQGTHQLNRTTHCERASVPTATAWGGGSVTDKSGFWVVRQESFLNSEMLKTGATFTRLLRHEGNL